MDGGRGFAYTRLGRVDERVSSENAAIWECNEECGCPPECVNRVVGRGRTVKLDLFKTHKKGWGVRAAEFIPKGTFIAVYSGELLSNAEAEKRGLVYEKVGRTYLFDLDFYYIKLHLIEQDKKGLTIHQTWQQIIEEQTKIRREVEARGEQPVFGAQAAEVKSGETDVEDEQVEALYCIDAFHYGNLTRFINHSCEPNVFQSGVYVDDGDETRPIMAFFAHKDIAEGEELCISYSGNPNTAVQDDLPPSPEKKKPAKKKTRGRKDKGKKGESEEQDGVENHEGGHGSSKIARCYCGAPNCKGIMFL
ncbi:SET domain-containing protein [Atractiella rhizophila]|nr:SET domain-containing protein [Atractiella rhizophila]